MAETIPTKVKGKRALGQEIASSQTDPLFYSALEILPNPDTVLRKLGKSYDAFDAIHGDAHVIGELQSVRAGLLRYERQLTPGGDSPADMKALELCEQLLEQPPAPGMRWGDVAWNILQAKFYGLDCHEVFWKREGNYLMPEAVKDRPQRRFAFSLDNELRLLTRNEPIKGIELGAYKWLLTRHMPSQVNPYGVAVYSACYWPYLFKHGGWRYFVKFCEKYGLPWPIAKYPPGTGKDQVDEIVEGLQRLVEDSVAAIPDGGSVELLSSNIRGDAVQERLINLCNREMSKAITSQTLATEVQDKGTKATAEVHQERQDDVSEADREMVADSYNTLFAWVTVINVAGAKPPKMRFYEEEAPRKAEVEFIHSANKVVDIPKEWAYGRLNIPQPQEGEDILPKGAAPAMPPAGDGAEFSRVGGEPEPNQAAELTDELVGQLVEPVRELLLEFEREGKSLTEFRDALAGLEPEMDETRIGEITELVLFTGLLKGMSEAQNGR